MIKNAATMSLLILGFLHLSKDARRFRLSYPRAAKFAVTLHTELT